MKVQYLGTDNSWMKHGETFTVLSIEYSSHEVQYRIIAGEAGTPALFSAKDFKIVNNHMPSTWVVNLYPDNKSIELAPKSWLTDGFWERYFDMDASAIKIFNDEYKKISAESQ